MYFGQGYMRVVLFRCKPTQKKKKERACLCLVLAVYSSSVSQSRCAWFMWLVLISPCWCRWEMMSLSWLLPVEGLHDHSLVGLNKLLLYTYLCYRMQRKLLTRKEGLLLCPRNSIAWLRPFISRLCDPYTPTRLLVLNYESVQESAATIYCAYCKNSYGMKNMIWAWMVNYGAVAVPVWYIL